MASDRSVEPADLGKCSAHIHRATKRRERINHALEHWRRRVYIARLGVPRGQRNSRCRCVKCCGADSLRSAIDEGKRTTHIQRRSDGCHCKHFAVGIRIPPCNRQRREIDRCQTIAQGRSSANLRKPREIAAEIKRVTNDRERIDGTGRLEIERRVERSVAVEPGKVDAGVARGVDVAESAADDDLAVALHHHGLDTADPLEG